MSRLNLPPLSIRRIVEDTIGWGIIAFLAVLVLLIGEGILDTYPAARGQSWGYCGVPPIEPLGPPGCRMVARCVCDNLGCRWVFICLDDNA